MTDQTNVKTSLYIELTDDEIKLRASDCTKELESLEKVETFFKKLKKEWADKIKISKVAISTLSKAAVTKREWRDVECIQHFDTDEKETWYEYEGTEYNRRTLDTYEIARLKQTPLFKDKSNLPVKESERVNEVSA